MSRFSTPKIRTLVLGILIMPTILLTAPNSDATTYHVTKTGQDSNSGSAISPFQTIKKGIKELAPGDSLFVHTGTYGESILDWETPIPNGKSWEQAITIAAYPGDTVTILPGSGKAFFWITESQAKFLILDGFIIDGQNKAMHGFKFQSGPTHIRVQNTEIKNTKNSAILVTVSENYSGPPPDTYHEFLNLHVHHNGSGNRDHGFYIQTSRNLVEGGKFHDNTGNGGKFFQASLSGVANHNIARNNVFHDNSQSRQWSCGLILSSGEGNMAYGNIAYGNFAGFCIQARVTNAQLFNNIAYENEYYGIYVGIETTEGSRVENNTVYKNGVYGIFVGDKAKNTTVTNNIAYMNANNSSARNIGLQIQTGTIVSNNFTSDPLFENAAAKDFRLKEKSPAIDQGEIIQLVTKDFAGTQRPQGSSYDIGAYEAISEVDNIPPLTPRGLKIVNID